MNFFDSKYQYISNKTIFGLCDDEPPPHKPAYLDENDGSKWIAIVENDAQIKVKFVALDHCIKLLKPDGKSEDRCSDGLLEYNSTIIFVELTTATHKNWKSDKDDQLRVTISHFERTKEAKQYKVKKACIANSNFRVLRPSYQARMERFLIDTGYDLSIENRIKI
ncbi:MAG: hypothetical protein LBL13_04405 [Bacteroidales bacterium]|jgi:hypothetical protein|nr:hypothetical protein [Bacteroidales bacterium]